jgi:hypothetical protein
MKREMLTISILIIALAIVSTSSVNAGQKQTVEGHMEGLNCIIDSHVCPVDNLDPHIAFEPDFVLYQGGTNYYLLLDVPRVVKARHIGEKIRVTGEVKTKYKAIRVDAIEVERSGKYKKVWSKSSQWNEWKKQFYRGTSEH